MQKAKGFNRFSLPMPTAQGIAPNGQALYKLPIGARYHDLYIEYSGLTLSDMTEIRVKINGLVVQRFSATERDLLNQFLGLPAANGVLRIPFDRVGLKNRVDEEITAINTDASDQQGNRISSFAVEIDIAGTATAPVLTMTAEQSDKVERLPNGERAGPGVIPYITKSSRNPAGAGEFEISDFNYGKSDSLSLNRITFMPDAGAISEVEVLADNVRIFKRSTVLNERIQTESRWRKPQAGAWVIDTSEKGFGAATIPLIGLNDFRYRMQVDQAMQITALQEYNGVLPR